MRPGLAALPCASAVHTGHPPQDVVERGATLAGAGGCVRAPNVHMDPSGAWGVPGVLNLVCPNLADYVIGYFVAACRATVGPATAFAKSPPREHVVAPLPPLLRESSYY
jgi:hypothetical protein